MKKPKYVHGYIDRHGKPRFYFRQEGSKQIPLPGLPWSPTFMEAYEAALAGQSLPVPGSRAGAPGSLRALSVAYFSSTAFRTMKASTQSVYRNIIERLCLEHGDKRAALLQRQHVIKLMAARADKPDSANGLRKCLRALMTHAIDIGLRKDDPTRDVKPLKSRNRNGFHRWTEEEITPFEQRHPIGTKPRLAMALGLYFGQARQDVVAMGPQHIKNEVLEWVRKKTEDKTGIELFIKVHSELREIIDATPSGHLNFLVTEFGKPFTEAGYGNWFKEQCYMANLPHCTSRAAQSRCRAVGGSWLLRARNRGHHRPRQHQGSAALHEGREPQEASGNGHGQNEVDASLRLQEYSQYTSGKASYRSRGGGWK